MAEPLDRHRSKTPKITSCLVIICLLGYMLWHGPAATQAVAQAVSPAPSVDPLVDPLSEEVASPVESHDKDGILNLDIETLGSVEVIVPAFDIEVSSVTKQESTVGKSPAAVFVITNEMIRRSGATCIPEVLRLAPGVEVARLNSHDWCISIRGFNDRYSTKLLVLVDGRSVYTQILSGVFWDMIDIPLEDIERIEVIRGPGGTLWGANAVNGIINIISKNAKNTQGVLLSTGGGNQDLNISTVRYGGNAGKNVQYRVWGKYFDRGPEYSPGDYDAWGGGRGGFYADWHPRGSKNDLITVQGNFFGGKEGVNFLVLPDLNDTPYQEITTRRRVGENSLLARWTHTIDDESSWSAQAYWDQTARNDPYIDMTLNTFDVELQYRRPIGRRHSVITGVEFRQTHDFLRADYYSLLFDVDSRSYNTTSGYVQDEIEMVDDKFYLTAGSKFEGNTFTGFEYQPSLRALWAIDERHALWGAVSRAVRTPNRFEEDGISYSYFGGNTYIRVNGSHDTKSEDVVAYELGYRAQTNDRFSWDVSLFFNQYENLLGFVPGPPDPLEPFIFTSYAQNCGRGESYGVEWTANWEATKTWRLAGSYSFLVCNIEYLELSTLPVAGNIPNDPRNQIRLQSYWNFAPKWQFDVFWRYVDRLAPNATPNYMTMDVRLGYKPNKNLDLSLVGQNLFAPHHAEFKNFFYYGEPDYEINRAVFAKMTLTR